MLQKNSLFSSVNQHSLLLTSVNGISLFTSIFIILPQEFLNDRCDPVHRQSSFLQLCLYIYYIFNYLMVNEMT